MASLWSKCWTPELWRFVDLLHTRGFLTLQQALKLLIQNITNSQDLAVGHQLYQLIVSQSLGDDLICMFAACESLEDAKLVVSNVGEWKNAHLWCAIISTHVALGKNKRALDLYEDMWQDGILPNSSSFVCLLKACANIGSTEQGQLVQEHIRRCKLESDVVVGSALVYMYAKCGSLIEADKAFLCIHNRNVVSWGALISGYAQYGKEFAVLDVFKDMQQDRVFPNKVIILCFLKACGHAEDIEQGW